MAARVMTGPGYRPDRFARAVRLVLSGRVEPMGGRRFRIAGNVEPEYFVDLDAETPCYCRDMENRGRAILYQCKHTLAAKLANLDQGLVQVLADRIEKEEREAEEARASSRRSRTRRAAPAGPQEREG